MLQRKGFPSEIYYVPQCFECGKPILDFRDANVSTVDETDEDLIPIGTFVIPSAGAFAVCKACDETGRGPWVTADRVFRNDQRYEFEKRRGL